MKKLLLTMALLSAVCICEANNGQYTVDNNGWVSVGSDFSNRKISIDSKKLIEVREAEDTITYRVPTKSELSLDDNGK